MGKLDGRTAIGTSASRGIGQAIAALFAAEGARVAQASFGDARFHRDRYAASMGY